MDKTLRKLFLLYRMSRRACCFIFHQVLTLCSQIAWIEPFTSFVFHVSNLYIFRRAYSIHEKKHIDLFWHTLPSAERIKSIQRRVCTDSHVYTQTHKHCNTWTLLFGSVLYTFSPSMFDQCCAAAFKRYLVNSKSEHSVQYKMYQNSFLLLTTNVFLAQIAAWLEGWQ